MHHQVVLFGAIIRVDIDSRRQEVHHVPPPDCCERHAKNTSKYHVAHRQRDGGKLSHQCQKIYCLDTEEQKHTPPLAESLVDQAARPLPVAIPSGTTVSRIK